MIDRDAVWTAKHAALVKIRCLPLRPSRSRRRRIGRRGRRGMDIGIMHDLAVGAHPGGADAWAGHDVLVRGASVGAPVDAFNQYGQNWSLPPWHPGHLAAQGYRLLPT